MRQKPVIARRGQNVRKYRYKPGRRLFAKPVRNVLAVLCLAGVLISGIKLYQYIAGSINTRITNGAMSSMYHVQDGPEGAPIYTMRLGVTGVPLTAATPAPTGSEKVFQKIAEEPLTKFNDLLHINKDVTAWLRIPGELDLPVVYRDNEYYLTRDVYKKKSAAGTLFLDEFHPLRAATQYLLLHGHNMKDGSMFGRLHHYLELDYLKKNCIIQFDTLYKESTYVVYAVLVVPENKRTTGYINYLGNPVFQAKKQFDDFVEGLKSRSVLSIPVSVDANDALLTLSTCYDEDRLLVAARRMRPDESVSYLKQLVSFSFKP